MPPSLSPTACPRLLVSLEEATLAHPFDRKLLVCRRPAEGRELLRALAASGVAWAGWEPVTVRAIALDAAALDLAAGELSLADEFDVLAAADEAIDEVVERGGAGVLAEGPGARDAIRAALATLRRAGIEAVELRAARRGDARLEPLAAVLDAYGQALGRMRRDDDAGIARRALHALASGGATLPGARLYLLPGLPLRGVAGRLTRLLMDRGARVLETDPVIGLEAPAGIAWAAGAPASPLSAIHTAPPNAVSVPEAELFAAATPADELREVLRRVVADGAGWDRVEIVAPDPAVYGGALESLGRRLEAADEAGVPSTFAEGIDVRRTRVGRALASYFRWIGDGFPADELRGVLDAGDLDVDGVSGAALSRRLRRLRVGWGQARYLPAIGAALAALPAEDPDDAGGVARAREELGELRELLAPILDATPRGPDRIGTRVIRTSVSAVAAGALAFLERVPARTASEAHARAVLRDRLERARETLVRATSWDAAISTLRTRLQIPVAPSGDGGLAPWTAAGGRVHLAGFFTGGLACRAATFVVGLDASAGAADGGSDPLLTDADRHLLNQLSGDPVPPLATSAERAAEARHELAALLARLRGRVTLSYAAWDAAEGRASSPAPELLQVVRHREGSGTRGYRELRAALGPLACAVPRAGRRLDAADAWLAALTPDGRLRDGRSAVRTAFAGLRRGVAAAEARTGAAATAYHGVVTQNGYAHLPEAFSASALETLGACPRRYFYRYVLRVAPHDDPEWDPESWLGAGERGGLLHRVFERTLREARLAGDDAHAEAALAVLEDEAARTALLVPPPSESVRVAELAELRHDLLCWVEMVREAPPRWIQLEYRFGPGHGEVSIGGLPVVLRGVIDRVDQDAAGRLRVVDYKTGKPDRYHPGRPLAAGRRVQHLVYAIAANRLLGAEVDSAEFHFPTRAGRNERVTLPVPPAAEAEDLLSRMATLAAEGPYLSTEDSDDCAYCDFGEVCRSRPREYGGAASPPAAWMKATGIHLPEARVLMELRGLDG
jgi:CRISPR/Cas system-associated exonuclease Cas4 (RecB family)